MKIRAQSEPWNAAIAIAFFEKLPNGKIEMVKHLDVEIIDPPGEIPKLLDIDQTTAQVLMDDLWNCGIRPSEGSGSAGQLASVKYHLEDMRRLVFKEEEK